MHRVDESLAQSAINLDVLQLVGVLLTAMGLIVAVAALLRASRQNHEARQATLSWAIYQEYVDQRIRAARGAVQQLACSPDCVTTGQEYLERVADGSPWSGSVADSVDADVRRLLRLYNQLSILLDKRLIDDDFIFGLIGPGLLTIWPVLRPAIEYYEHYYPDASQVRWHPTPRLIYHSVPRLYERSRRWAERNGTSAH